MRLQDQLCTPEQGKKLKELGIIPKSQFYHNIENGDTNYGQQIPLSQQELNTSLMWVPAFSAAELVQMLQNLGNIDMSISDDKRWYSQTDFNDATPHHLKFTLYDSFAQACAAKLIRGIENESKTIEEINQLLTA